MKTFQLFRENYSKDSSFRTSGSNPAIKLKHDETKETIFIKNYDGDKDRENVEVASARIYNLLGIKTTNPKVVKNIVYTDSHGKKKTFQGLQSSWVDNLKALKLEDAKSIVGSGDKLNKNKLEEIALIFLVSVLVRNHDVVGMFFDNLMYTPDHSLVHVDAGGSFHYRAQGDIKSGNRTDDEDHPYPRNPEEVHSMLFSGKGASKLFLPLLQLHPEVLLSASKVFEKKLSDEKIKEVVLNTWKENSDNPEDISINDEPIDDFIDRIISRRNIILEKIPEVVTKLGH